MSQRLLALLLVAASSAAAQSTKRDSMIARARALELPTPYVPVPGDPRVHEASGLAKVMCSAVFITGLDPEFAYANVGWFTASPSDRASLGKPVVDRARRTVSVQVPNGPVRVAKYYGDQGCVTFAVGDDSVHFRPEKLTSTLRASDPWPMGDAMPASPLPPGVDTALVRQAVAAAFENPAEMTAEFVVTWKGRVVGEGYGAGITPTTPLESWSMGKSLSATLMGIMIRRGVYSLTQPAPIPEWQTAGDPRQQIRIMDLLHMSSGIRIKAPNDPDFDTRGPYPDHLYLYTGPDAYHYAATRPQQWPPNTVGRYRNTDPVLTNYLTRLGVENVLHEDYLSFPRRALFEKIGARSFIMETDPQGDFLTQGYELATARDWARLGNLYLQDGVWNGERILPEGFVRFVSTIAPAWAADNNPIYGGFFWINGDGALPIPKESYSMQGAGGQSVWIIPSHDLVVVRLGHYRGSEAGEQGLSDALAILMRATAAH
jgi:CubicO group peptidase (beta-lactamase class C family)